MKKSILALAVLATAGTASAFNADIDVNIGDIYKCEKRVKKQRQKIRELKDELFVCQTQGSGNANLRKKIEILKAELDGLNTDNEILRADNIDLQDQNDYLSGRVISLEQENADLRRRLAPPVNHFDLAKAIRACKGIKNSSYASQCAQSAKRYKIRAKVIEGCAKISNTYYAAQCVEEAGKGGLNARQTTACSRIRNTAYAASCVSTAAALSVPASVINACVDSNNNDYYKVECMK
jgi:hypothetical protein